MSSSAGRTRRRTRREQSGLDRSQLGGVTRDARQDGRAAFEVPTVGHPAVGDGRRRQLRRQSRANLRGRPHVELALDPLAVRIQRRSRTPPSSCAQLADRPVQRLLADAPEQRVVRDLPGVQVRPGEQRVVVEHLLEVGDRPPHVDRVAREPAADLVVRCRRRPSGASVCTRHRPLAARQEELDHGGERELRCAAPAAELAGRRPRWRIATASSSVPGSNALAGWLQRSLRLAAAARSSRDAA